MGRFEDKTALVTGGASGIGAETARALAAEGAHVLIADVTDASALAAEIGGEALALDVREPAAWSELGERRIDLGVLNAGVGARFTDLLTMDDALIDLVLSVNVAGVVRGTRELLRRMPDGGRISVTASMASLAAHTQSPLYGASKWAVAGWVLAIAPSIAERGVLINAVCPGLVDTPILGPGGGDMMRGMGLRVLDPVEVAHAHLDLLAGDESGRIVTVQAERPVADHRFATPEGYQG
jgi:NAD(P)-dependent dehydrogenase (short-subunit alcohol dehydrogenase family)